MLAGYAATEASPSFIVGEAKPIAGERLIILCSGRAVASVGLFAMRTPYPPQFSLILYAHITLFPSWSASST